MSDFLLDELSMQLVRMKKLTVVNHTNLDIIKREMDFQLSGEVSDETIQSICAKVEAKIIIHGTLRRVDNWPSKHCVWHRLIQKRSCW